MSEQQTQDKRPERDGHEASLRMKIGGMSCSFCTGTIRAAYERMEGVHEVGISLAHEEGLVRYDPSILSADKLKRTLHDIGYTYRDPNKVLSFEEEEAELRQARTRLLVAGSFTGASLALMLLGMEPFWTVLAHPMLVWVMLTLALWTMFLTGLFIKRMAFASVRRGIFNQHVLLEFAAFAGLLGGAAWAVRVADVPGGALFRGGHVRHDLSHPVRLRVEAGADPLGSGHPQAARLAAGYRAGDPRRHRAGGADRRNRRRRVGADPAG